jgi:hypothetical protein
MRPVDVEEAKRHDLPAVGAAEDQAHALLIEFVERVDRGKRRAFCLRRGERLEHVAGRHPQLPLRGFQLIDRAFLRLDEALTGSVGDSGEAFAIDAHRGGDEEPPDFGAFGELFQEDGGAEVVDRGVVLDVVHALADADSGGHVANEVGPLQGLTQLLAVTHVARQEFGVVSEIDRLAALAVHLRVETIEHPDAVAGAQQLLCEVRPDEAGTPDDQRGLRHKPPSIGGARTAQFRDSFLA